MLMHDLRSVDIFRNHGQSMWRKKRLWNLTKESVFLRIGKSLGIVFLVLVSRGKVPHFKFLEEIVINI